MTWNVELHHVAAIHSATFNQWSPCPPESRYCSHPTHLQCPSVMTFHWSTMPISPRERSIPKAVTLSITVIHMGCSTRGNSNYSCTPSRVPNGHTSFSVAISGITDGVFACLLVSAKSWSQTSCSGLDNGRIGCLSRASVQEEISSAM